MYDNERWSYFGPFFINSYWRRLHSCSVSGDPQVSLGKARCLVAGLRSGRRCYSIILYGYLVRRARSQNGTSHWWLVRVSGIFIFPLWVSHIGNLMKALGRTPWVCFM